MITLIFLLQNHPNQKASDLAEKLGVSLRTIHRYFGMLNEMGIPAHSERGPCDGFSLVRGYKMPPLVFTLEKVVAVVLGMGIVEEMWGDLYRESPAARWQNWKTSYRRSSPRSFERTDFLRSTNPEQNSQRYTIRQERR